MQDKLTDLLPNQSVVENSDNRSASDNSLSLEERVSCLEREIATLYACLEQVSKSDKFEILWRKSITQDMQTLFNRLNAIDSKTEPL